MCLVCKLKIKDEEEFAGYLMDVINKGTLSLMISVGHRTGLFDAMKNMPPSTSQEIAEAAGLNERYVREWLGAMATSGVVAINPEENRYLLPAQHASFLTRDAGANNFAVFMQYVSTLGEVESKIVNCFRNGGGVPYDDFTRFHEVMAEDSGQSVLSSLTSAILPIVPGIEEKLKEGIYVLDAGCGSGKALNLMARTFPASQFVGYDLCEEPITMARAEAEAYGLTNVKFEQRDLTYYEPDNEKLFDFITAFDAIHDQARPDNVLAGINKALKDDGIFLMQDIDGSSYVANNMNHPMGTMLYAVSTMHCMTVSLAQGGMGLGTMWGVEKAQAMLNEAGFDKVNIHRLEHDPQNCYYVVQK